MINAASNTIEELRLKNQLCYPLYALSKEIVRQYRKPLKPLNLTYTQYLVMMVLWEFGTMTESEIGEKIRLDSGTLAPLLKRMEKLGYITRQRPENNERLLVVSLTAEGAELRKKAEAVPCAMRETIPLTDEEMMELKGLLDKALNEM